MRTISRSIGPPQSDLSFCFKSALAGTENLLHRLNHGDEHVSFYRNGRLPQQTLAQNDAFRSTATSFLQVLHHRKNTDYDKGESVTPNFLPEKLLYIDKPPYAATFAKQYDIILHVTIETFICNMAAHFHVIKTNKHMTVTKERGRRRSVPMQHAPHASGQLQAAQSPTRTPIAPESVNEANLEENKTENTVERIAAYKHGEEILV